MNKGAPDTLRLAISAPHCPATTLDPSWPEVAVIVPVYKGASFIKELTERLHGTLQRISASYTIVFVDDRSPDDAWTRIRREADLDARVLGVRLSRNFGQHGAITAGIAHVQARWYVVMDGDLQDPPEAIPSLHAKALETGAQIVIVERETSGLGLLRNLGSTIFNSLLAWASGLEVSNSVGNFRLLSNRVAEAFRRYPEQLRFFPAIMSQVGFDAVRLRLPRSKRSDGKSSYTLWLLLRLAFETIVAYSERPLRYMTAAGFLVCLTSFAFGTYIVIRALVLGAAVPGFATIAALIAFLGGAQISITCFVGMYVGRVFGEAKRRPVFIVDEVTRQGRAH